jgi:hypothetical protein
MLKRCFKHLHSIGQVVGEANLVENGVRSNEQAVADAMPGAGCTISV